jgi:ABC-2 type transport system permease protein/sodium transport system permease protein
MNRPSARLIFSLTGKELREILRDRRTLITLLLMPILLYPLLGMAFNYFLISVAPTSSGVLQFRIAVRSDVELRRLAELLRLTSEDPDVSHIFADPEQMVRTEKVDVGVEVMGATQPLSPRSLVQGYEVRLIRLSDSVHAIRAEEFLTERLHQANVRVLKARLRAITGEPEINDPVRVTVHVLKSEGGDRLAYAASLVPLVLVLMTITGAVYPAIDLTAGERERGTLEILIAAPVPRLALLLAKYVAVLTVALLTGLINLTMMTMTLVASGLGASLFPEGFSVGMLLAVLALLVLFAAFFSAVLLAITSFARSFKEAQAYLIPVMLLAISPGIISLMPGVKLSGGLMIMPLVNVVLLARDLLSGDVPLATGAIVVICTLLYAAVAIGVAARLFGAEAVLYSEQGQIGELFRRATKPREESSLNAALICLALAFPLAFLLNRLIGLARELPISAQMGLLGLVFILLFVGLPLVPMYFGRVRLVTGFQLDRPPLLSVVGALFLGLSLWPFILELALLQEKAGFTSLPEAVREAVKKNVQFWRQSPGMVLLAMGLIPGIVEELFFRGFLFNAFRKTARPTIVILATAATFGLFHIFPGGFLAIERLLPSTLMGIVLGWVRHRSDSIWPGVVLHVTHNSLLLSAALFPQLVGAEVADGESHLPTRWLVIAAAVCLSGLVLQLLVRRSHKR